MTKKHIIAFIITLLVDEWRKSVNADTNFWQYNTVTNMDTGEVRIEIYGYSGFDTDITVPSLIDG